MGRLFISRGVPDHIRSDNGGEFADKAVRNWLAEMGVKTLFNRTGSPWENGYNESSNGKLRDECLNTELFYTLREAHHRALAARAQHDPPTLVARLSAASARDNPAGRSGLRNLEAPAGSAFPRYPSFCYIRSGCAFGGRSGVRFRLLIEYRHRDARLGARLKRQPQHEAPDCDLDRGEGNEGLKRRCEVFPGKVAISPEP